MSRRNLTRVFLSALALMFCGCVHQEIALKGEPKSQTTLTVTRAGDSVQLGWKSEAGKIYNILYAEKLGGQAQWKVLPSAGNLRGTGDYMTFTDSVAYGVNRYYRLNIALESQREISR
jgi:uncharacterized protein YigE (DUF2233 family)